MYFHLNRGIDINSSKLTHSPWSLIISDSDLVLRRVLLPPSPTNQFFPILVCHINSTNSVSLLILPPSSTSALFYIVKFVVGTGYALWSRYKSPVAIWLSCTLCSLCVLLAWVGTCALGHIILLFGKSDGLGPLSHGFVARPSLRFFAGHIWIFQPLACARSVFHWRENLTQLHSFDIVSLSRFSPGSSKWGAVIFRNPDRISLVMVITYFSPSFPDP